MLDREQALPPDQSNQHGTPLQRVKRFAEKALENYEITAASTSLVSGGGKQILYVVSEEGKDYGLRMYTPISEPANHDEDFVGNPRTEAALRSQLLWLNAMQDEPELGLPLPILTKAGALLSTISLEGEPKGRHVALLKWVSGDHRWFRAKGAQSPVLEELDMFRLGAYTGRLHLQSQNFSAPENFIRPTWDYETIFGGDARLWNSEETILSSSDTKLLSSVAERLKQSLSEYGKDRENFGLIHRDLQPKNLVFYNDHPRAIDFDHCGWGYYLYDLSFLLFYIDQEDSVFYRASMKDGLISGYMSERPLSQHDLEQLETFVVMRHLNRVNYILWKVENTNADRAWGADKLNRLLVKLRAYASGQ